MKILLTDSDTVKSNGDLSLEVFKRFGTVAEYPCIGREELLNEIADTDIILCNKTVIDREVFKKANSLKYIGLFATGYNNIDTECAKERGITVCNAGTYSENAVAQQVFGYILHHYTAISRYDEFVKNGGWINSKIFAPLVFPSDEICGKTLGIIGYGSIGKAVKRIADAFGMKPMVYTRTVREDGETRFVSFDELLANSDIVTVHCPLNAQSENMMNGETFSKMKDGAFFINTSRGGVLDENALFDALESGKLSGAAVDVLRTEPMSADCLLINAKNIIITPHTAWAPLTTRRRLLDIVVSNIQAFLNGTPQNKVC